MHLEGTHKFSAPPERIWTLLNDPDVLARTTPGLSSLEPDGDDVYKARFRIKLGPVNGGFDGSLAVLDKDPPRGYRLEIDVGGRLGTTKAEGTFEIRGEDEGSVVAFAGDARLKACWPAWAAAC